MFLKNYESMFTANLHLLPVEKRQPSFRKSFQATARLFIAIICLSATSTATAQLDRPSGYLNWSKYFGGTGVENAQGFTSDGTYLYLVGVSTSATFPTTGSFTSTRNGTQDLVVVKLQKDGTVVYTRRLGSSTGSTSITNSNNIKAVNGELYFIANCNATGYPVVPAGSSAFSGGFADFVVTRLDATGNIVFSRYLGGSGSEDISSAYNGNMFVENGFIYVAGNTTSSDYPVTNGTVINQTGTAGINDVALTKLDIATGAIVFSTYIGGDGNDNTMSLDVENGYMYIGISDASVTSASYPTTFPFTNPGGSNFLVAKFDPSGNKVYARYIGGTGSEGNSIPLKAQNGEVYLLSSPTANFPTTDGSAINNASQSVALKLDAAGNIVFSRIFPTVVGNVNAPTAISVNNGKMLLQLVPVSAPSTPTTDGTSYAGGRDYFLVTLNSDGSTASATIIGSTGNETFQYMPPALVNGYYYLVGTSGGTDFPVTNNSSVTGSNTAVVAVINAATGKKEHVSYLPGGLPSVPTSGDNPNAIVSPDGKDIYFTRHAAASTFPVTTTTAYGGSQDFAVVKYSLCPTGYYTANDKITMSAPGPFCKNGLGPKLTAPKLYVPTDSLPKYYVNGVLKTQEGQVEAGSYQWQKATALAGPFTDIAGATSKDFTATVGTADQYFRRVALMPTFCGAGIIHISDTAAVLVNANTAPTISTATGPLVTCPGSVITIGGNVTAGSSGITDYTWDQGIGSTGTTATVNVSPAATTVYTQTITDGLGCKQIGQTTVSVKTADAGADQKICASNAVTIGTAALGSAPAYQYSWSPATGLSSSAIAMPIASAGGTYTVTLTLQKSNDGGVTGVSTCTANDAVVVTEVSAPEANFAGADQTICYGSTATLGTASTTATPLYAVSQSSVNGGFTGTVANLADADATNGARTNTGSSANVLPFVAVSQSAAGVQTGTVANLTNNTAADGVQINLVAGVAPYVTLDLGSNRFIGGLQLQTVGATAALGVVNYTVSYVADGASFPGTAATFPNFTSAPAISNAALTGKSAGTVAAITSANTTGNYAFYGRYIRITAPTGAAIALGEIRVLEAQWIQLDLGSVKTDIGTIVVNSVTPAVTPYNTTERIFYSNDAVSWTQYATNFGAYAAGTNSNTLTAPSPYLTARYIRLTRQDDSKALDITKVVFNQNFSYTWTPGANLSSTTIAQPTYNPGTVTFPPKPDPATYTLTTALNGCTFTDQVVVSTIKADAGLDGCGPRTIGGSTTVSGITQTYSWTILPGGSGTFVGGGTTSTLANPTVTASATGLPTTYRLTVTANGTSCTDDVIIADCTGGSGSGCNISIKVNGSFGCPNYNLGGSVQLVANNGDDINYDYAWTVVTPSGPNAGLNTYTGSTVSLTDGVMRTYRVTMTSKLDPSYTCFKDITVNDPLMAKPVYTAQDPTICPGGSATLGQTSAAGLTYLWTGTAGKLTPSYTDANPSYTAGSSDVFVVKITDNVSGCFTIDTATITVPALMANAGPDWNLCIADTLQLGTPAVAGQTYSWSPASANWQYSTNNTSAQPQPFVASDYTVLNGNPFILTTTHTASGCIKKDTVEVTFLPSPPSPVLTDVTICKGATVKIGPSSTVNGYIYSWSPATGLDDPNIAQPTFSGTATTTYTLTVSFAGGCAGSSGGTVTVTVNDPSFSFATSPISYCPSGGAVTLSGAPAGMSAYSWSPSGQVVGPTTQTPTTLNPPPSVASTYKLTVTKTVNSVGCSDTASLKIIPNTTQPIAGSNQAVCLNSTTTLGSAANSTVGATYAWSGTAAALLLLNDITSPQPTFTPTATGVFTYTLTRTETATSCSSTDNVTVTVKNYTMTTAPSYTICNGGSMQIGPTTTQASTTYSWAPATGLSSSAIGQPIASPTTSTNYLLTATGINGCAATANVAVVVSTDPAPAISMSDVPACYGTATTAQFNPTVTPGSPATGTYLYSWSPTTSTSGNVLSSNSVLNPTINLGNAGSTAYTLTVTNNTTGCSSMKTNTLTLASCPVVGLSISGNVFNDLNGYTDNLVNGAGTNVGGTLYAHLLDANGVVISTVAINSDGTYSFSNLTAGTYYVSVNTNAIVSAPGLGNTGYVSTGDANQTAPTTTGNDGLANGLVGTVTLGVSNIINVNFAIEQPPTVTSYTAPKQLNPGGTITASVAAANFNAPDPNGGTTTGIRITGFPTNATSITIDGSIYTLATFPVSGVTVPTNAAGQPTKTIAVDPLDGDVDVSIPFVAIDNAGKESIAQGTVTTRFAITLPLNSIQLTGAYTAGKAALNWKVTGVKNITQYEVERSNDGASFTKSGAVQNLGDIDRNYGFTDDLGNFTGNMVYYRIKVLNENGTYKYSNTVRLPVSGVNKFRVFPNPFGDVLNIQVSSPRSAEAVIRIISFNGQEVLRTRKQLLAGMNSFELNGLGRFAGGTYTIEIVCNDRTIRKRLLKTE